MYVASVEDVELQVIHWTVNEPKRNNYLKVNGIYRWNKL